MEELTSGKRISRKKTKQELAKMHEENVGRRKDREAYKKCKAHAALMEQNNESLLIVFPSVDAPWYKMGWKSALIYAYGIAPRKFTKKELPTIRKDTDHELRSEDGIVFIRSMESLINRLRKAGIYDYRVLNDGIYIFDTKQKYTKEEIKAFRNLKYSSGEELFAMAAPKEVYPELRGLIAKAEKMVIPKCKKMPTFYCDAIGSKMVEKVVEMNFVYIEMANGRGNKKDHLIKIVKNANEILVDVMVLQELDEWNPLERAAVGGVMTDIKLSIKRIINKEKNEKGKKKKTK